MQDLIEILKALADSTRLRMLKLLETAPELCVCEIMQALELSQSRASRNLSLLKKAGLVNDRREGLWVYYSLGKKPLGPYAPGLAKLLGGIPLNQTLKADRARLQKAVKLSREADCR